MSDLAGNPYASIVELSKAYRNKSVSPSEVTKAQLARIDALDTKLGSYQTIYSDEAIAAAKVADKAFTDGACLGPFHGIPFALKDIYELKDQITTCGSYEMRQRISSETGTVVRRLLAAGGIAIVKPKLSNALSEDGEQMSTWERRGTLGILNTQEFQEDLPQALALRLQVG